jgi:hypothetical protein
MSPLRISHGTINSAVDIVPFNSLNKHDRAKFEIVAAVVCNAEHTCFVIMEVEFVSVYGGNVRSPWCTALLRNVTPYRV